MYYCPTPSFANPREVFGAAVLHIGGRCCIDVPILFALTLGTTVGTPPVVTTVFPGTWKCSVLLTVVSSYMIVIIGTSVAVAVAVSSVAASYSTV